MESSRFPTLRADRKGSPPHGPEPRAIDPASATDPASTVADLQRQIEGLTRALRTRDVIGQAKGVLMSHYAVGDEDAFALLVGLSQHTNTKLHTIAAALLARIGRDGPAPAEHCQRVTTCLAQLIDDTRRAPAGTGAGAGAPPDPEG